MARLPPLQPRRISFDGEGLLRPFWYQARRRRAGARGAGMVDHARLGLGPRGLAVHPGTGGTVGGEAQREVDGQQSRHPRESGDPVRRGFTVQSLASLEYWVALS